MSLDAGWRGYIASLSLIYSISIPVFLALAALLTKYGLIDYTLGFGYLTLRVGFILAIIALGVSCLSLIIAIIAPPRKKPVIIAVLGLVISLGVAGRAGFTISSALNYPPIHDVQTNWSDGIAPSEYLLELRAEIPDVNPILDDPFISEQAAQRWPEFVGMRVADVQEASESAINAPGKVRSKKPYPNLNTVTLNVTKSEGFDLILIAIQDNGWELVTADPDIGRVEAIATSAWFGFKDDIMFRVRFKDEKVTSVDIRSVSRVGLSDLGANAKRIHALSQQLKRLSGDDIFN